MSEQLLILKQQFEEYKLLFKKAEAEIGILKSEKEELKEILRSENTHTIPKYKKKIRDLERKLQKVNKEYEELLMSHIKLQQKINENS